jgi:FkbM family methyltransferase
MPDDHARSAEAVGRPATRRVALITREYQPAVTVEESPDTPRGGIARAMSMHAHALATLGLEAVHVITLSADGLASSFSDGPVMVHRVPDVPVVGPPDMRYVNLGVWSQCVATRFEQLDAEIGFDVVEAPDWYGELLHLRHRPETAVVVSLHSLSAVIGREQDRQWTPGERAWDALELLAVERADRVIAPTQHILDATAELLGDRLPPATLIPLPFDASRFPARPVRPQTRGPLTLTFVGRIERLKGVDLVIKLAAAARRAHLPVRLQMLGRPDPGYWANVIQPLVASLDLPDILWAGEVSESEVAARLRQSDCAILPSRFENFHMAAVEALSSGVPVITTDRNGLSGWFSAEQGLLTLPADDAPAFSDAAIAALADRQLLANAGAAGAERVRQLLAPENVAREVLAVYDRAQTTARPPQSAATAGPAVRRDRRDVGVSPPQAADASPHEQALAAFAQGQWREAQQLAARGLHSDGTVERLNDVAVMLAEAGRLDEAALLLTACLVIRPGDREATGNLEAIRQIPGLISEAAPELAGKLAAISGLSELEVTRLLFRPSAPVDVPIRALDGRPIRVRPGTSDVRVLDDTYGGLFHLPDLDAPPAVVVDLGSNIGTTLAHYATLFPRARMVGVELDAENAALCRRNIAPWGDRITLVEGGIAAHDGTISYAGGTGKEHGYRIDTPGDRVAQVYTIDSVLDRHLPDATIDFLKVDIEGAESDVFKAGGRWTRRVRTLKAELHDPYTVEAAISDLAALGFDVRRDAHHWACVIATAA